MTSPFSCVGELNGRETASRTPPAAPNELAQRNAPVSRSSAINHAALSRRALLFRACTTTTSLTINGSPWGNKSANASTRANRSKYTSQRRPPFCKESAVIFASPDRSSDSACPGRVTTKSSTHTATARSLGAKLARSLAEPTVSCQRVDPVCRSSKRTVTPSATNKPSGVNLAVLKSAEPLMAALCCSRSWDCGSTSTKRRLSQVCAIHSLHSGRHCAMSTTWSVEVALAVWDTTEGALRLAISSADFSRRIFCSGVRNGCRRDFSIHRRAESTRP